MQKVIETPEWQEYLETNYLVADVRWGEDFATYLEETAAQFEKTLTEVGAL